MHAIPYTSLVLSARPWVMDYVDINGLSNRIGLPKDRFIEFIVKETVDNTLDFMEKEAPRLKNMGRLLQN